MHTGKSLGEEETETGTDGNWDRWKEGEEKIKEGSKESIRGGVLGKSARQHKTMCGTFQRNKGAGPIEMPEMTQI